MGVMKANKGSEPWEVWGNAEDRIAGRVVNRRKWLVEAGKGAERGTLRLNYHRARKETKSVTYTLKWK